jgi:hypothetical protein
MKVIVTMELTLPEDGEKLAILAEMSGVKLAPTGTATLTPAAAAAPRARKPKTDAPAAPAPAPAIPAAPLDPLMQDETTAPPAAPAPAAPAAAGVLTEDQSLDKAKDIAKRLVEAYPEKEPSTNRPKGFRLAMELLGKHKVARTTDLVHAQRVQFVTEGEALIGKAPVAVAA